MLSRSRRTAERRAGLGMSATRAAGGSCCSRALEQARADAFDAAAGVGDTFVDPFDARRDEVPGEGTGAEAAGLAQLGGERRVLEEARRLAREGPAVAR